MFKHEAYINANATAAVSHNAFPDYYNLVCNFLKQLGWSGNLPAVQFAQKAFDNDEHPKDYANRLFKDWTE